MTEQANRLPVRNDTNPAAPPESAWPSFGDLRREVDRLFEDFGRGAFAEPRWPGLGFDKVFALKPAVDVVESDGKYRITVEVPGIDAKEIDVRVSGDMLTIKGQKSETKEQDDKGMHVSERRYGAFERSFRLPAGVEADKIEAACKDGVLTLTVPKSAVSTTDAKKIDIKAA